MNLTTNLPQEAASPIIHINDPEVHTAHQSGFITYGSTGTTTTATVEISSVNLVIFKTEIRDLGVQDFVIKGKKIDVILKICDDDYIAIIPDLELYGDGDNEIEALNNLKLELVDLYEMLNSIPNKKLGKKPTQWKNTINNLIKKVNA
jgi:hypothetical protein